MSEQQKAEVYDILCEDYEINGSLADFVDGQDKRIKELEAENAMQSKLIAEQDAQLKQIYQIIYDNREAK